jgi:heptosyltransferase-2
MNPRTDCVYFTGAKPCGKNNQCDHTCAQFKPRGKQILLIHLGALGAVVRSTALLKSIKTKYPNSQITWVTQSPAHHLLKNHPDLHRVLTLNETDMLILSVLSFDVAFIIDKSIEATGVLRRTSAREVFGFVANSSGVIHPHNKKSWELWKIGLSDQIKFFENKKTEIQLMTEALELGDQAEDYFLPLTSAEQDLSFSRRQIWNQNGQRLIVGLNTGCAATIAAKKLSVDNHRELIRKLRKNPFYQIVLLGGPEDEVRNKQIAEGYSNVIQSPTGLGLRDGLASMAACDIVVSGDSLGLHMAISQKKQIVAWFGPTCAHEIELYGRGEKILTQAPCSPCWKRSCHKPVMCYDLVNLDEITVAVDRLAKQFPQAADQSRDSNGFFGRSTFSSATFELGEETSSPASTGLDLP